MRKPQPGDFVYQVASLVLAFVLVHAFYVTVVRPNAEAVLAEQARLMRADRRPSSSSGCGRSRSWEPSG
jgi:hypothetical protein